MRVRVNDVEIFFDVEGAKLVPDGSVMREKPTLLLLHGGPGFDHSILKPWFSSLEDVAQLVYIDHRGNGRSGGADTPGLDLARWGDDVQAFCAALEIERPIVLGVSFGGFVAQSYATRHPDHPKGLVLCSTSARHRPERALDVFERLGGAEARAAAASYLAEPSFESMIAYTRVCLPLYNRTPQDPDLMARALPHANFALGMSFFRDEIRRFDFLPQLSRVRCPTLVAAGEDDPITPIADGEDIAAALPPHLVRFERFAGCGHPVYQDDARFLAVLREFIASL